MSETSDFGAESSAVQKHLDIMQGVIARMAENSRYCKIWCVTLVAATLVFVARTGEPRHVLIALAPTFSLYLLDAYYLMLEKRFRNSYAAFVDKVHFSKTSTTDLFTIAPSGSRAREFLKALFTSFSVLPFYLVVAATVLLSWLLIF